MAAKSDQQKFEDMVFSFVDDPYGFVQFIFPWKEPGTFLAQEDGPDQWQTRILQKIGDEVSNKRKDPLATAVQVAVASGHGIGKTTFISWIILWFMSTRPNPQIVVTSNTKDQLLGKTWRELSKWHQCAFNAHWFEHTATRFYFKDSPETWFASAVTWSKERAEAFAGTHEKYVLVVYDESSLIDDSIWEVTEGAMTTPGAMWIVFGNPTRNTGRFSQCFGKFRHRWLTEQIDSRQAKKANARQIQQWIDDYGEDSDFVRVRVRGVFPRAGSMQFIGIDVVEEAQRRSVEVPYGAPKLLGVDIARYGDDQTVILRRHGRKIEHIDKFRGLNLMETASMVAHIIRQERPDAIFIDGVGMGAGVVDRLQQLGHTVIEVNAGSKPDPSNEDTHYNKRVEMWDRMKEWLKTADIPDDNELYMDLIGPEYGFDNKMRMQLEKKEDMKSRGLPSPDIGDALALTFAYVTPPRVDVTESDYEPELVPDY